MSENYQNCPSCFCVQSKDSVNCGQCGVLLKNKKRTVSQRIKTILVVLSCFLGVVAASFAGSQLSNYVASRQKNTVDMTVQLDALFSVINSLHLSVNNLESEVDQITSKQNGIADTQESAEKKLENIESDIESIKSDVTSIDSDVSSIQLKIGY